MSKRQKWLIIVGCIMIALLLLTFGLKLAFDFVAGPIPILIVVFIIYGIGRVWTRSPSKAAEPSTTDEGNK